LWDTVYTYVRMLYKLMYVTMYTCICSLYFYAYVLNFDILVTMLD